MPKHYLEVQIVWSNNQTISRITEVGESSDDAMPSNNLLLSTLFAVQQIVAQSKIASVLNVGVKKITVKSIAETNVPQPHSIRFSNICGRIKHTASYYNEWPLSKPFSWTVYKDNIRGALQKVINPFGRSVNLLTLTVNYSTSDKQQYTLFKGGVETARIRDEIKLVMQEDAVERVTVHMVVGTGKLGHFVSSDAFFIDQFWRSHSHMKCVTICVENESSKRLSLEDFTEEFYTKHGIAPEIRLKNVLITIGYRGNVNIFFTFMSEINVDCNIESSLLPFCNYIIQTVDDFT